MLAPFRSVADSRFSSFTETRDTSYPFGMRRAYSTQASSAQPGSLALTARTLSLGTRLLPCRLRLGGEAHRLSAPHFLEVVKLAYRGMHDVHHHVAEIDQHPLAGFLALDAVHA